jgi:hypothetical protein
MKRPTWPWSTCHPKILMDCIKARKRQNLKKLAGEVRRTHILAIDLGFCDHIGSEDLFLGRPLLSKN